MIGTRLGPYQITSKLGEGGMGEVYRASDSKLKREVAIKVLPETLAADAERLARFEREAQLLAQLQHPNIASIYGLEESEGQRALVMELVEGPTLDERMASGNLSLEELLGIARQIAEALEEAHEKGIVHRDLKPQNVKAPVDGVVKVLDFGLAKAMDPVASSSSVAEGVASPTLLDSPTLTAVRGTELGLILGTAAYMSPEQAKGRAVDKRADIWAFGVVLWEMLTGKRLFEAGSVPETLAAIFSRDLSLATLPETVPAVVRRLVARCLERDPRRRLRDIGEARLVLEAPFESDWVPATPPESPVVGARRFAGLGWWVAVILAVALGVLALLSREPVARPELIRFAISSASGASIAPGAGNSAISPDGRRVVFVGTDAEGRRGLWIQELDQIQARFLAGTEGATYPFWAPDSQRVGFFDESELRKVSIDDGKVDSIAAAIEGRGGSWGRGGTIVYAPAVTGRLWAVSEGGGSPRPATTVENPVEENSHRFPCFLPDGETFVYLVDPGADVGEGWVYLASLDHGDRRLLYRSHRAPIFAEPGYLIDAIGDRLVARAFDPKTGEVLGEPRRLDERTPSYVNTQDRVASASESGTLLVAAATAGSTKVVWRDRRGRLLGEIPLPEGSYKTPRLAPDGGRLAIVGHEAGDRRGVALWIVELATERASRLTFASGSEDFPVWSPDGASLAFQSNRSGVHDIYIRPSIAGGDERVLHASTTAWKEPRSWVDNKFAFVSTEHDTGFDIYLLRPDHPEEPPFRLLDSSASEFGAAISPDGRWLAYVSTELGDQQIYVLSIPEAGTRYPEARTNYQVTFGGGRHPLWSRSGDELFYLTAENSIAAIEVTGGESLAFGAPETLFPIPILGQGSVVPDVLFDVAPDGDRFVMLEPEGGGGTTLIVVTDWLAELDAEGP